MDLERATEAFHGARVILPERMTDSQTVDSVIIARLNLEGPGIKLCGLVKVGLRALQIPEGHEDLDRPGIGREGCPILSLRLRRFLLDLIGLREELVHAGRVRGQGIQALVFGLRQYSRDDSEVVQRVNITRL